MTTSLWTPEWTIPDHLTLSSLQSPWYRCRSRLLESVLSYDRQKVDLPYRKPTLSPVHRLVCSSYVIHELCCSESVRWILQRFLTNGTASVSARDSPTWPNPLADSSTPSTSCLLVLSTIADIYPKHVRGDKLSVFGVAVVIAPAVSPLIGSLVVNTHEWQIIYWIVLGLAGLQFAMFFLLVPETLWNEDIEMDAAMNDQGQMTKGGRVGPAWMPWHRPRDFASLFWNPIAMVSDGSPLSME